MHKGKYKVKPLSDLLTSYVANNDKLFSQKELDSLPDFIKDNVIIEREKESEKINKLFIDKAFKDFESFHYNLHYPQRFGFSVNDITYFMYKLRDNKDIVKNTGYTKYSFVLEITNGVNIYDDSIYKLIITETATGKIGIYEKTIGRFD